MSESSSVPRVRRWRILTAWAAMLLISDLPDIVWHSGSGQIPEWLIWGKVGVAILILGACLVVKSLRSLWPYSLVMLVFQLALGVQSWVRTTDWWHASILGQGRSFFLAWGGPYVTDVGVALAVIAVLWLVKRRRQGFFLVKGDPGAPIEPVRWLGIPAGESWRTFGWIFAFAAGAAVLLPTVLAAGPTVPHLLQAAPLLPACLLLAAVNAFTEEIYCRASFLATLPSVIGRTHALLITIVYFGLAHVLYGSPPGLIGALMTGFLAFLLGKAMLETKGFTWPWLIHFIPDVVVFAFYALVWVAR